MKPPVLFIVGPTAAGKSRVALHLARRLKGDIISADSMQVYRGMDIGTDKPPARDRKAVPHHLVDILPPSKNFSVFDFRKRALAAIKAVSRKGRLPIVCGGTGLYLRALIRGLDAAPAANPQLRRELEAEWKAGGCEPLFRRLKEIAPERAAVIDAHNPRRLIRALEIAQSPAVNYAHAAEPSLSQLGYRPVIFGIRRERAALYAAIDRRVQSMFRRGWVAEVKRIHRSRISQTAAQALGYREISSWLRTGGARDSVVAEVQRSTRRFAKRQLTWFRREPAIEWIDVQPGDSVRKSGQKIVQRMHEILQESA